MGIQIILKKDQRNILLKIAVVFFFSTFIISLIAVIEQTFSVIFTFFILLILFFVGIIICTTNSLRKYRKQVFWIFFLILFINILAMTFSSFLFKYNLGIYTGASDETLIYSEGDLNQKTWNEQVTYYKRRPYSLYLYTLSFISIAARTLGGNTPFNFKLLSVFFGSCIPVVIFFHYLRKYPFSKARKISIYSGLFPVLIYFSSIGVRDIIIVFLTSIFFFFLISKTNTLKKTLQIIMVITILIFLRPEHAVFLLCTYIFYLLIKCFKTLTYLKLVFVISYAVIVLFIFIQTKQLIYDFVIKGIIDQKEFYTELLIDAAEKKDNVDNSLTLKIQNLPFPVNYIGMYSYAILGTFPPHLYLHSPIIENSDVKTIYNKRIKTEKAKLPISLSRLCKAIGLLVWYFILPYIFIGLIFKKNKKILNFDEKFIIYICFFYIFLVSIFTADIGRIVPVYANLFSFGLLTISETEKKLRSQINTITFICIPGMYIFYFAIKIIQVL